MGYLFPITVSLLPILIHTPVGSDDPRIQTNDAQAFEKQSIQEFQLGVIF